MATVTINTEIAGVAADIGTVVLEDPTAAYGIKRNDTDAVIVAAGTAMDHPATGRYTKEFSSVFGVSYTAYVKLPYGGANHYRQLVFTANGDIAATSIKAAIATILDTDARSVTGVALGALMEYDATNRADLVFFTKSPQNVAAPKITYRLGSQAGFFPKRIELRVTAWGDNFAAILDRVYTLLHKRGSITTDEAYIQQVIFERSGQELYDEDLRVYYREDTYQVIAVKK